MNITIDEKIDKIYTIVIKDHEILKSAIEQIKNIDERGCRGHQEKIDLLNNNLEKNYREHIILKSIGYASMFIGTFIAGLFATAYYGWSLLKSWFK